MKKIVALMTGLSMTAHAGLGESTNNSSANAAQSTITSAEQAGKIALSTLTSSMDLSVKGVGFAVQMGKDSTAYVVISANGVKNAASKVGNAVSDAAVSAGNAVSDAAVSAGNAVSDAAVSAGNAVSDATVTVVTSTGQQVSAILNASKTEIVVIVDSTGKLLSAAGKEVIGFAQSAYGQSVKAGKYSMNAAGEIMTETGKLAGRALTSTGNTIGLVANSTSQASGQILNASMQAGEAIIAVSAQTMKSMFSSEKVK